MEVSICNSGTRYGTPSADIRQAIPSSGETRLTNFHRINTDTLSGTNPTERFIDVPDSMNRPSYDRASRRPIRRA